MIDITEYTKSKIKLEAAIAKACDDAVAVFSMETCLTPSSIRVDMVRMRWWGVPVDQYVVGNVEVEVTL